MKEIKIVDKSKYLDDNYPFYPVPKLTDKRRCIHCDEIITVGKYKVWIDEDINPDFEYISCPNSPDCDGTVIDWIKN
mgnify:CR=1 FL=1